VIVTGIATLLLDIPAEAAPESPAAIGHRESAISDRTGLDGITTEGSGPDAESPDSEPGFFDQLSLLMAVVPAPVVNPPPPLHFPGGLLSSLTEIEFPVTEPEQRPTTLDPMADSWAADASQELSQDPPVAALAGPKPPAAPTPPVPAVDSLGAPEVLRQAREPDALMTRNGEASDRLPLRRGVGDETLDRFVVAEDLAPVPEVRRPASNLAPPWSPAEPPVGGSTEPVDRPPAAIVTQPPAAPVAEANPDRSAGELAFAARLVQTNPQPLPHAVEGSPKRGLAHTMPSEAVKIEAVEGDRLPTNTESFPEAEAEAEPHPSAETLPAAPRTAKPTEWLPVGATSEPSRKGARHAADTEAPVAAASEAAGRETAIEPGEANPWTRHFSAVERPLEAPKALTATGGAPYAAEPVGERAAAAEPPPARESAAAKPLEVEPAGTPPEAAGPVRHISVRLEHPGESPVRLNLVERHGEVHLAVRTPDPEMGARLRTGLGDLAADVEARGVRAEFWTSRAETDAGGGTPGEPDRDYPGHPEGQDSGGGDPRRQRSGADQQGRPRWVDELESAFPSQSERKEPTT